MKFSEVLIPLLITRIVFYGLVAGVDVFSAFACGAKKGLKSLLGIFPSVLAMLVCVSMLRSSGALDMLTGILSPLSRLLGIPSECLPLAVLKPVSGGGALAIGSDIIRRVGVDSYAGRVAAVMLASADTAFFVISMYFGSLGIKKTGFSIPCALAADIAAFTAAAAAVRFFMH